MSLLLNTLVAVSVRLVTPWSGAWYADVDVDLDDTENAPTGPAILTIGATPLKGTVDPRASGPFGVTARVRLVAGGGGWDKPVDAKHWHNDAGVPVALVLAATGAEVGEAVSAATTDVFGADYARTTGPAGSVLPRGWYVDLLGVTQIVPRVALPLPDDLSVMSWDPTTQVAELSSDSLIFPGMTITDPRFGTVTIRDVEQTFTADSGARAKAWCGSTDSSRLSTALATFVRNVAAQKLTGSYVYRVIVQGPDGKCALQAQRQIDGVPDMLQIPVWYGAPGLSGVMTPSTLVLVIFAGGDRTVPVVVGFDGTPPVSFDITAPVIGLNGAVAASTLAVAGGVRPVAAAGPVLSALQAVGQALTTISAATVPPTSPAAAAANLAIQSAVNAPPTKVLA